MLNTFLVVLALIVTGTLCGGVTLIVLIVAYLYKEVSAMDAEHEARKGH